MTKIDITVDTKPYEEFKLYQRKNFTILPGITSLVGCNGSGKSTLISLYLKSYAKRNKITVIEWNDRVHGGYNLMDYMLNVSGDMQGLANMTLSSEGERIAYGLSPLFGGMKQLLRDNKGQSLMILLDSIDSGMSVDEIIEIRDTFLDMIIPDAEKEYGVSLYIIIAANNFEWCNDPRIHNINIQNGKPLSISGYDEYKKIILNSRKVKDKLRGAVE